MFFFCQEAMHIGSLDINIYAFFCQEAMHIGSLDINIYVFFLPRSYAHRESGPPQPCTLIYAITEGFPQALENLENHKKVPCIEKSWNLKKPE